MSVSWVLPDARRWRDRWVDECASPRQPHRGATIRGLRMEAGLIEALNGRFLNGLDLSEVDSAQHRVLSILDNLNRLFNTRCGSIDHLQDYGLPDITQVYRDLPYSIEGLRSAIKEAVRKYEPRLRRVRVDHQQGDPYAMRITFILSAELLRGQKVQFQTTFASHELAQVAAWRQPG